MGEVVRLSHMLMRPIIVAVLLLCLYELAVGLLTHRKVPAAPTTERAAPEDGGATQRDDVGRADSALPAQRAGAEDLWRRHLDVVEKELARGHVDVAIRVWHDARGAARASQSWESMIAVGDAFMAIGRASGAVNGARINAQDAYITALIRARRARSVDGALRSAEAFRDLGDEVAAETSLRVAEQVADGDRPALQRIGEVRQRWATRGAITEF
jgi:hypothetical protein